MAKKEQSKPDPETFESTDPQEHMEGPVSSMMQKAKKGAEHNDNTKKEAEKHEHKKNTTGGDFIAE
ncbi:hypothetical protein [Puia sp.]|jgi:hypothetical protein|uniref:hypothetical protein n=1 Tax=Puia sp. TaxID=2045100 RepID=UPI002F401B0B